MTDEQIRKILEADAKATPGPWEVDELFCGAVSYGISGVVTSSEDGYQAGDTWWSRTVCQTVHDMRVSGDTKQSDNMRMIALSRNHIRELCEEVLALRAANDKMREALEPFAMIGDPRDYAKRPNRLDVPLEWCERAYRALEHDRK